MRILIVRLDAIGDMVLMSPFLREVRGLFPEAHITLLIQPGVFNLVELCPYIDEVRVDRGLAWLWRRRWDLAISPRFDVDHFGANRIVRLSFARRQIRWRDANRFNTAVKHEVERNLEVLTWLGAEVQNQALETWRGAEDVVAAQRFLAQSGEREHFVALVPGASHAAKQWPLDRFIKVGEWLVREHGFKLLVLGNQNEKPLGRQLQAKLGANVINATGQTSLREASALLAGCQLYIGNDTGLMHLAAAEHVPVVMISRHVRGADERTRSSPKRFGPWGVPHEIVQPSAGDISHVSVHDVKHAAVALLGHSVSRVHSQGNREVGAITGI